MHGTGIGHVPPQTPMDSTYVSRLASQVAPSFRFGGTGGPGVMFGSSHTDGGEEA